eukprot:CAMPEP_0201875898 /NCGR_PEP_ID=MMETSP0902-20130614/7744_1 /ASSEMBLY_ACC=CAM_ASM_000551 /TAXON_ID=420261 /ORGANISM="Thalassiosira antarctica, Strain CCMP982" /LENGTH=453 /DNA_ID=CAMNT_0048403041 /DNA_START=41 /DNA_END=1402 /DNA_ORIENTATION=-
MAARNIAARLIIRKENTTSVFRGGKAQPYFKFEWLGLPPGSAITSPKITALQPRSADGQLRKPQPILLPPYLRKMAARNIATRLIRKVNMTSVIGGGIGQRSYHGMASNALPTTTTLTRLMSSTSTSSPNLHHGARAFSTGLVFSPNKGKKSPHSKLLRVCSERNANSHFAAIEADLLRLDWKETMDTLVEDWTQKKRFDDIIELESNVRTYVNKNVIDLTLIEKECVREWERGKWEQGKEVKKNVSLSDHIRFHYFPYEEIITGFVNDAIAGKGILSSYEMKKTGGNKNKIAMAEIHGRIRVLSKAGKLLDAMTSLSPASDATHSGWTTHHTSCSKCYRSMLSGWFLLHRRLREANKKLLADADAADILEATARLDIHPEQEAHVWAEKWIEFCTSGHGAGGARKVLLGGISPSDKPLLMGVVKILSMSENAKRQTQSVELDRQLVALFPDE